MENESLILANSKLLENEHLEREKINNPLRELIQHVIDNNKKEIAILIKGGTIFLVALFYYYTYTYESPKTLVDMITPFNFK